MFRETLLLVHLPLYGGPGGFACHKAERDQDYVFTKYETR